MVNLRWNVTVEDLVHLPLERTALADCRHTRATPCLTGDILWCLAVVFRRSLGKYASVIKIRVTNVLCSTFADTSTKEVVTL